MWEGYRKMIKVLIIIFFILSFIAIILDELDRRLRYEQKSRLGELKEAEVGKNEAKTN